MEYTARKPTRVQVSQFPFCKRRCAESSLQKSEMSPSLSGEHAPKRKFV